MNELHLPGFRGRRIDLDLSPEEVAVQCKVSLSTVKNWEAGRMMPRCTPDQMMVICKAYDCTLEELVELCRESSEVARNG